MSLLKNPTFIKIFTSLTTGGAATAFFGIFQGRCTFAAIVLGAVGVYGWLHGRDIAAYALFVTALQGLLVLHSWKEDQAERNQVLDERRKCQ